MSLQIALRCRLPGFDLDVAFEAPSGVTALFGRSGSGKTTVVNAVAGLLRPDTGRIVVEGWELFDSAAGRNVPPHRRRIGYVFQESRLFPHLTVRQNLAYGRWFAKIRPSADDMGRIIDLLGLEHLLSRQPGALSGGEKQRVAIGRAVLSRPRLLLMDEPLAALDEGRRAEILPYLERIRDQAGIPILYVSHSIAEVARLATTVVAIEAGRVLRVGAAADILSDPDTAPSLGARGAGAVLDARVLAHHPDGLTEVAVSSASLFLPRIPASLGTRLRIRIEAQEVTLSLDRPERISALNILPSEVTDLRQGTGPDMLVQLRSGQDRFLARITRRSADSLGLRPGTACYGIVKSVSLAPENIGQFHPRPGSGAASAAPLQR